MTLLLKSTLHQHLPIALTNPHTLLLTANQRLARHLNVIRASHALSPAVSLSAWIQSLWLEGQDRGFDKFNRRLLTANQETFLWRALVKDETVIMAKLSTEHAARMLQRARAIVDGWHITRTELSQFDSPETRFLLAHLELFEKHCNKHQLITLEEALSTIREHFTDGKFTALASITLYGFQDLSPLFSSLLLAATSNLVNQPALACENSELVLDQYTNSLDELGRIASICKTLLSQSSAPDKQPIIGIIVPNLADIKPQIEDVFTREFAPSALTNPGRYDSALPIDFSLGNALIDEAVIADIPLFFTLLDRDNARDELLNVCRSPFWGFGLTDCRWTLLDWLQQQRSPRIRSSVFFAKYAAICEGYEEAAWLNTVIALRSQFLRETRLRLPLPNQVERIKAYLQSLRWPGPRVINSREYQAVSIFFDLLTTLNSTTGLHPETLHCHFNTALGWLTRELRSHIFQVQKPSQPIQIMGIVEGSGLTFDYCFAVGLTDDVLPAKPNPSPLLPLALQRRLGTPRASIQKEIEYGQKQMAAFATCAPVVRLSYHSQTRDSQPLAISPLIAALTTEKQCPEQHHSTADQRLSEDLENQLAWFEFDNVPCGYGPALRKDTAIPGGSNHIKVYGSNPFYAFCRYRLGVVQPSDTQLGFSHLDRGNLLHLCMANFWLSLKKDAQAIPVQALQALGHEQLLSDLDKIVRHAVADYIREQRTALPALTIAIEIDRLQNIILPWLDLERSRPDFSVVDIEARYELTIAHYSLVLRLDRLDKLKTGELLVIDYKTGNVTLNGLAQRPLREPQLPLYALAITPTPQAVAFAKLRPQQTELIGLGDLNQPLGRINRPEPPLPEEWSELINYWRQELHDTVKLIGQGHAEDLPVPKSELSHFDYLLPLSRRQHLTYFFDHIEKNNQQRASAT